MGSSRRSGRRPHLLLTHITKSWGEVCGLGIQQAQRLIPHPKKTFLFQFCWLGHAVFSLHTIHSLGRQGWLPPLRGGDPEPHHTLSVGHNSLPLDLMASKPSTHKAWEAELQGPRAPGAEVSLSILEG